MLAMLWTSSVKPAARMCSTHCPQQPHDGLLLTTTNGSAATSWVWCVIVGISDIGADVVGAAVSGAWAQAASAVTEASANVINRVFLVFIGVPQCGFVAGEPGTRVTAPGGFNRVT